MKNHLRLNLLFFLIALTGCQPSGIKLRPFPYPYRAALALSSDIDNTDSPEEFLTMQEYLCTTRGTRWGKGLGLEVGNSFWFYDPSGRSHFTIFQPDGRVDSAAAPLIENFLCAGYIDALHTYGDFNDSSDHFRAALAQRALAYFQEKGLSIPAWVNHGNPFNRQAIGRQDYQQGDNPGAPEYHAALLRNLGIRYIESWQVTHRVSLDRVSDTKDLAWHFYEMFFTLKEWLGSGYRDLVTNVQLLNPMTLEDGQTFWRFRRFINADGWMPETGVDCNYLAHQLTSQNLDRLAAAGGYQIIYTHFGANENSADFLPDTVRQALSELADRFHRGEIFVTTTTRLLDYNLMTHLLRWNVQKRDDTYLIQIEKVVDPLQPQRELSLSSLQGLTFYTPDPAKTQIYYDDQLVRVFTG